jgi:hypothetical protein
MVNKAAVVESFDNILKTYHIELLVRLKTADTVALTAKNTLQRDMGYESVLLDVRREERWIIQVQAEDLQTAEKFGREFAATRIFVNPNKQTCALKVAESGQAKLSAQKQDEEEPYEVGVIVSYYRDGKAVSARDALRHTYGYGGRIGDVERGVLWKLLLNAQSLDSARKTAEDIALTSSMNSGLLANFHSQTYVVL